MKCVAANIHFVSAREIKDALGSKSGISRFLHAGEYRRATKDAYWWAKVALVSHPSYRISHYHHRRLNQRELETTPAFLTHCQWVHHWHQPVVGFTFVFPVYPNLTPHWLEDISDPVIEVALPLYRCYLSCKDAFPSSDLTEEWKDDVLRNACKSIGGYLGPLPSAEMASPIFCHM
jgi:hypothetical protein